ncbi:MAG: fasciclin domain-containing protein [Fulvivirga sp.]|nr:fasciclin domain-containing protein [Fulvivirga sp.]
MKSNINLIAIVILLFSWSCTQPDGAVQSDVNTDHDTELDGGQSTIVDDVSQKNIVQVAASSDDHTTLVEAVKAAGLVDVLANNGPLTVFAPTNAAFDKLPKGTLDELMKPENKSKLVSIIHYHAAPGTYKDKLLKDDMNLFMATGDNAKINVADDGTVTVNGAQVLATVEASNGVVHVIDQVIFAPEN